MEFPASELPHVVALLTSSAYPDIQKAAICKYFTPDAAFRHPLCAVDSAPNSRQKILGIYRWYRVFASRVDIQVYSVVFDQAKHLAYCDVFQDLYYRGSPFGPRSTHLTVRLHLRKGEDGLYYIASQHDLYQPDEIAALAFPPLAPLLYLLLRLSTYFCIWGAYIGGALGLWSLGVGRMERRGKLFVDGEQMEFDDTRQFAQDLVTPTQPSFTFNDGFGSAAPQAPVTFERPYRTDEDNWIERPYIARANVAPSVEHPGGSPSHSDKYREYSVLQQHVLFWDRDSDGIIWPTDTFVGFRDLGFNVAFSLLSTFIINFFFSLPTRLPYSYIPDPFFRIYVPTIHKAKHGSNSGVYDTEGRFIPSRFEDLFAKYATPVSSTQPGDTISLRELLRLVRGDRLVADPYGWGAALFEWGSTWLLLQKDGKVHKEDLRKLYDGSIFFEIRAMRKDGRGWDKGWGIGGDGFLGGEKVLPFGL